MALNLSGMDVIAAANKGATVEIFSPTSGGSIGLHIMILGKDSDNFKAITTAQNKKRLTKMMRGNLVKPDLISQGELDSDAVDALVAVTKGWFSDAAGLKPESLSIKAGEETVSFSAENCKRLYTEMPWIKEQVDAAVADRANFTMQ